MALVLLAARRGGRPAPAGGGLARGAVPEHGGVEAVLGVLGPGRRRPLRLGLSLLVEIRGFLAHHDPVLHLLGPGHAGGGGGLLGAVPAPDVVGEGGEHCWAGRCDVFRLEEGCTLGADRSVCCVVLLSNRAAAAQQPTV